VSLLAGVEDAGLLDAPEEGVEVDGHQHGRVDAAGVGQLIGRVALDELAQRPAHGLGCGAGLDTGSSGRGLIAWGP
jgi:hypothetical protein